MYAIEGNIVSTVPEVTALWRESNDILKAQIRELLRLADNDGTYLVVNLDERSVRALEVLCDFAGMKVPHTDHDAAEAGAKL